MRTDLDVDLLKPELLAEEHGGGGPLLGAARGLVEEMEDALGLLAIVAVEQLLEGGLLLHPQRQPRPQGQPLNPHVLHRCTPKRRSPVAKATASGRDLRVGAWPVSEKPRPLRNPLQG